MSAHLPWFVHAGNAGGHLTSFLRTTPKSAPRGYGDQHIDSDTLLHTCGHRQVFQLNTRRYRLRG